MPTDYTAIATAWDGLQRRYTPCNTCHHRQVVQVEGASVVACASADVGTRATVTPVDRALSAAGACGPEAAFWLHPSDAANAARKPAVRATTRERVAAWSALLAEHRNPQRKECA